VTQTFATWDEHHPHLDPDAVAARVAADAADLIEPAKVTALEQLDEGKHALEIAASWLRGKLAQTTMS
jgi:hypothetical protein